MESESKVEGKHSPMDLNHPDDDLIRKVEAIRLPTREEHAHENGQGYGVEALCFLNVFNLSLENAPKVIYKYELTFTLTKSNGDELQLHNALIKVNDFVRSNKRGALVMLTRMMHEGNKDFFRKQQLGDEATTYWRNCCAFDCGASYYTGVDLPNNSGEIPEEMWKSCGTVQYYVKGKGPIRWNLSLVETFRIDGEHSKSQQALQFFDVLSTQQLIRNQKIDVKPDAAYLTNGEVTRDNKELRKGIVTASKVMGGNICIQMDSKISMFFQEMALLDYIKKVTGMQREADLARFLNDRVASRKLRKELINLPLRCRHIATKKAFECKGFHKDSANDTTFMMKTTDAPISVAEYYAEAYKYRLNFPNLPLIIEKNKGGHSYHAIECLDIADGVRVSNQKMSREAQENMISKSCRAPAQLGRDLDMSREIAGLDGKNKYLNAFNVRTVGEFAKVKGKILAKPFIAGMGGIHPDINERGQISYTKGNFKFADPAKPSRPITLIALSNAMREDDCRQMKDELRRFGGELGMQIEFSNVRDPCLFGGQAEPLRDFMMSQRDKTSMFFFITKEKMDESHDMVKKLEQELGVVTQLICAKTAGDVLRKMRTTEYNVIAKMNQKLGGVVANPEVPPALKTLNPEAFARASSDWFKNRMFVGFTLSHAGSQSYADRVVGEEVREPTCVGMAWTLRQPGKRTAMGWFQEKRKPIIDDITRHFVRALDTYAESNDKKMPTAILIFRKGMSEGELKRAAFEVKQVMEAVREVCKRPGMADYRPTVQCVVCMANTSDRLFYNAGDANVPAGMCLDEGATHPDRCEFVVVPHNAIKGTARAVRCTLVHDKQGKVGRRLEYAEIQSVYHTMCYLNGVAASPTRLPVPLSDSEKAAERQMNNFKEAMRNGDDTMSMCSGRSTSGVTHDGTEDFYKKLSDQFAHKFKDLQYYA